MSVYLSQLKSGTRVATAPHTDSWMSGERYGTVTVVGRKWVHLRGERSGRLFKLAISGPDFAPRVEGLDRLVPAS